MLVAATGIAAVVWKVLWQYANSRRERPTADWGWPVLATREHALITPSILHSTVYFGDNKPVYVVGDIHGCYDEFKELLDMLPAESHVILVGDVINKGPQSLACLRLARQRKCLMVCGNHELVCIWYRHLRRLNPRIRPEYAWLDDMTDEEVEFLRELPYTITLPELDSIVVHAGLVPGVPLHEQNPFHLLMLRNTRKAEGLEAVLRRALGLPAWEAMEHMEMDDGSMWWAETWTGPQHVYYGHDARRKLRLRTHSTGLDAGCLYGHSLAAICIQTRQLISIPAKRVYVTPRGQEIPQPPIPPHLISDHYRHNREAPDTGSIDNNNEDNGASVLVVP